MNTTINGRPALILARDSDPAALVWIVYVDAVNVSVFVADYALFT